MSVFAGIPNLATQVDTNQAFFPLSPSPNYTGPNVATIDGQKYQVTADNYSTIARMYIEWQRRKGVNQYDDHTPATDSSGQPTTQGNLYTISLLDAYRQLAGLKPIYYSVDPLTGVAIPDTKTSDDVLNNPLIKSSYAVSRVGTALFDSAGNLVQGGSQSLTDLAGVLGTIGKFFQSPGTILLVGLAIVGIVMVKKKVI
jgi:hypothetical protein